MSLSDNTMRVNLARLDGLKQLEELIIEAQDIIRDNRQTTIYDSALKVESFLSKHAIPVNYYYEEKDYYTYNAYPIINFLDICNAYNVDVKSQIDETAVCRPYIYNFIHQSYFKLFELVKFFNIFFPNTNHKFTFATFTKPARFNKSLTMTYVHPKYILEEVLHQLCLIENINKFDELKSQASKLIIDWIDIDGGFTKTNWKFSNQFDSVQINILSAISTLDAPIIRCFYDRHLPIIITNSVGIKLIEHVISSTTANYERKDSTSKSFFDNRIGNTIFRIAGKQIVKIFPLLDYEIITINESAIMNIKSAKFRHQQTNNQMKESEIIMDCHINVALRLIFNEYITYDIIGSHEIANIKLQIFAQLYDKFGINELKVTEKNTIGIYYPFIMYLKELQVASIKKNLAKRQN